MAVDSFFANTRKRKRPERTTSTTQRNSKPQQNRKPVKKAADSDIEGDEEDDHFDANQSTASEAESSDEEIAETAAEKRVRLAKAYLGSIKDTLDGKKKDIHA
jgi:ribosomal RNA-processing protein 9